MLILTFRDSLWPAPTQSAWPVHTKKNPLFFPVIEHIIYKTLPPAVVSCIAAH